ncbi:flavonol synthase 1 isoform X2 [Phragmites australis]|uniref:flavonol synthase 1 isoform X2 n=1 Tax=Phragmites australis TaxID=29695 RepID=UPI002D79B085|nr:flavonol synthase 1 isoform X2 [Phragmites australis]
MYIYYCYELRCSSSGVKQFNVMGEMHQSVQALAASLGAVPPEFVRSEHEQPGATTFCGADAPEAPVIDMSEPGCGARMVEAAREWGLFQVVNHGVPAAVVAELQLVGRAFFALPQDEKERHAMDPASGKIEGYGTKLQKDLEGKKTWNDFFFHVVAPPEKVDHGIWPKDPAGYREANEAYCAHMQRLTRELFEHLSLGLGLEKGAMSEAFGGDKLVFLQKINFYPPCPQPELTLGVAPHTDMSTLTILVPNEVQGLQIFRDGHWYDAKYVPGALIVHIGDQIESRQSLAQWPSSPCTKFSATGGTRPCCTGRW